MQTMVVNKSEAPAKPVLVYDADCNFCRYWASRWRKQAGPDTECVALQDGQLAERFPEVPRREWEQAIHLVDTNGAVYSGAEAVFRFRARNPRSRLLLKLYTGSKLFAAVSDAVYRLVSHNRGFFSWLWGTHE